MYECLLKVVIVYAAIASSGSLFQIWIRVRVEKVPVTLNLCPPGLRSLAEEKDGRIQFIQSRHDPVPLNLPR